MAPDNADDSQHKLPSPDVSHDNAEKPGVGQEDTGSRWRPASTTMQRRVGRDPMLTCQVQLTHSALPTSPLSCHPALALLPGHGRTGLSQPQGSPCAQDTRPPAPTCPSRCTCPLCSVCSCRTGLVHSLSHLRALAHTGPCLRPSPLPVFLDKPQPSHLTVEMYLFLQTAP